MSCAPHTATLTGHHLLTVGPHPDPHPNLANSLSAICRHVDDIVGKPATWSAMVRAIRTAATSGRPAAKSRVTDQSSAMALEPQLHFKVQNVQLHGVQVPWQLVLALTAGVRAELRSAARQAAEVPASHVRCARVHHCQTDRTPFSSRLTSPTRWLARHQPPPTAAAGVQGQVFKLGITACRENAGHKTRHTAAQQNLQLCRDAGAAACSGGGPGSMAAQLLADTAERQALMQVLVVVWCIPLQHVLQRYASLLC